MKYDVCIIGHGNFPDGVKSAIDTLVGGEQSITCFNLNLATTHDVFRQEMEAYLNDHPQTIIFADMTGGAPFQIVAELILASEHPNQYIVSSVSLNAILDLYLKNSMDQLSPTTIQETFKHVIDESCKLMQALPNEMPMTEPEGVQEGWI